MTRPSNDPADSPRLVERLHLHSSLLDNAIDAIAAHTLDGTLAYANAAALAHWGLTWDEAASCGPYGWLPEPERTAAFARVEQLATGDLLRFECCGPGCDGRPCCVEVYARLVETPEGPLVIADMRDISNRVETEEMVRYLAYHDTLTGLANRVLLESELLSAFSSAERHGDHVGVLYLDLNNFKPVNDTYGHTVGDDVLREIANRISACVRDTDTVARAGGDEFVVLLPRLNEPTDLPVVARKLSEEISRPMLIGGRALEVSASIGLALRQPGESPEAFLTRADLAMYRSRKADSAGWELFSVTAG